MRGEFSHLADCFSAVHLPNSYILHFSFTVSDPVFCFRTWDVKLPWLTKMLLKVLMLFSSL